MKIKVYSTKTCHYCKLLKEWLREHKLEFEDVDVGKDMKSAQEMVNKSGQMGVPVTDIDGDILVGFNAAAIEEIIKEKEEQAKYAEEDAAEEDDEE